MDPQIVSRFNDDILHEGMKKYAIDADRIQLLDGFESFIYEFERPDGAFILRIGHSMRRSPDLIRGEVDWINHLAAGGARVARAILSESGSLVEPVDDRQGGQFLCTAFVRAPGGPVRAEQRNGRLYREYGRLVGRMHALAKAYVPRDPAWRRCEWDDPRNNTAERQMPAVEVVALEKYRATFEHLRSLPRDPQSYGIIHQDAHPGNFFVDDDYNITLFDFDDCAYGHFIYDIAMALAYTSSWAEDPAEHTARFMPDFLTGYRGENRLDPRWLEELPHFMKLREIDLYAAILYCFGPTPDDPWCMRYLDGRREKIEGDVPFIDFDWAPLRAYLT
jgi:amicoumacin kinase